MGSRSVVTMYRYRRLDPDANRYGSKIGSGSSNTGTVRIEAGTVAEHRTGDVEQAVGHRAQGARVSVATGAQRHVLAVADRIALDGDARPIEDSVAQSVVGRPPLCHEQSLARTPGDRSHPTQAAKCVVVPPPHRVAAFGEKRGEHPGADAGQRQQDGCVGPFCRRCWLVLRRRVRVGRRAASAS